MLIDEVTINNPELDRRVKLTPEHREAIRILSKNGMSNHQLAKDYGVSRKLIQFIVKPERIAHARELYYKRGGWRSFYDVEGHRRSTARHREYKKRLREEGLI